MVKQRMFFLVIVLVFAVGLFGNLNAKHDLEVIMPTNVTVGPFLDTYWLQSAPFNNDCPEQNNIHMLTGPVARAYAQIMNYHEWPSVGSGEAIIGWDGDICQGGQSTTIFEVPFDTYYDWDNMPDNCSGGCTPEQQAAVAKLLWDVAAAFETDFNGSCQDGGSGANPALGLSVLADHFRYYPTMSIINFNFYITDNERFNWIQNQIDQGLPLVYVTPGNAQACDGYKIEYGMKYIHLNPNGWMNISQASADDYIIIGIRPDKSPIPPCEVARAFYVSTYGSDSWAGDYAHPFKTIGKGIEVADECDTIKVMSGTYTESLNFLDRNIVVKSIDGPRTTTITNNSTTDLVIFEGGQNHSCLLEGFTISGGKDGVKCINSAPTIKGNIFTNQDNNGHGSISLTGSTTWEGNSPAVIINNTFYGNDDGGILDASNPPPTIKNNIISENGYGIRLFWGQPYPDLSYNDVWNNGIDYMDLNAPDPLTGSISENPLFADDLSLYEGSPCIDAGDPNPEYNDPDQSRNNMGAVWEVTPLQHDDALYVDGTNGNDGWTGTAQYPFATIQKAIDEAEDGFSIFVSPAEYDEALVIDAKTVAIISTDGPKNTTITHDNNSNLVTFINVPSSDARLEGFTLQGGWMGVWCKSSGPTISHNIFNEQNVTNWAALALSGNFYGNPGPSPAVVVNNTIIDCANGGISNFSTLPPTIKNNIILHNQYGIHQDGGAASPGNDYNDVWDNPQGPWYPPDEPLNYFGNINAGPNSINADPLLSPEFNLYVGSPCLNAGDPNQIYNDPDGSRNDMGALYGPRDQDAVYVPDDYATINEAISAASSGQIIYVLPGTYEESIKFNGKTLKLISVEGPENTTINAGMWGYAMLLENGEAIGSEINGFTITSPWCNNAVSICCNSSLLIQNCVFRDVMPGGCQYNWDVIRVGANNNGEVIIKDCVFYNNGVNGSIGVWSGASAVEILNNTIYGNKGGINSASANTICKNNIVTNSDTYGIKGTFASLDYNDVWSNADNYTDGASAGFNSISADPLYVDAANHDYHLQVGSPCINAGDPSGTDMGAYQSEGGLLKPATDRPNLPQAFSLTQNYPNPFNPTTEINFSLPEPRDVRLEIYNIMGQKVKTLIDDHMDAGYKTVLWDGKSNSGNIVASGIYFYKLTAGDYVNTKKMTLLK